MDELGWVGAGTGIAALVVSAVSALFAGLAWHAAHRQTNVAERNERQRAKDRREAEGPQFVQEGQSTISEVADVQFRMIGGPGAMRVRIYREDVPWLEGVSTHGRQAHDYVTWESVRPQQLVNLKAHLSVDPYKTAELTLSLKVEARLAEDPLQRWVRRHVPVTLKQPPWVM